MATESRILNNISAVMLVVMIMSSTVMSHRELSQPPQSQPEENGDDLTEVAKPTHKATAEENYFQSLPGEFKDYATNCAKQMSRECGEEIFGSILNKTKVSTICCHDLVEMGLQCHNALVKVMAGSPKYKHIAVQIIGDSRQVFNHCVDVDN